MSETFLIQTNETTPCTGKEQAEATLIQKVTDAIKHQYKTNGDDVAVFVSSANDTDFIIESISINENAVESRGYTVRGDYNNHALYESFCNMVNSLDLDSFSTSEVENTIEESTEGEDDE